MAWNDPFETQVDSLVEELGQFLQKKSALEIMDIMQIQEICRDFCNFLCKDVRKATKRNYTVYTQLHAFTPEEEQEYYIKLSYIKEFCDENPENQVTDSETQIAFQVRGKKPSLSLSERALMRERRATLAFETDPVDLLNELMMSDGEGASHDDAPAISIPHPSRESSEDMAPAWNSPLQHKTTEGRKESVQATPKKPLRAITTDQPNDLGQRTLSDKNTPSKGSSDSISSLPERTVESDPKKVEEELARLDNMFGGESSSGIAALGISPFGLSKMLDSESVAIPIQSEAFSKFKRDWEDDQERRPRRMGADARVCPKRRDPMKRLFAACAALLAAAIVLTFAACSVRLSAPQSEPPGKPTAMPSAPAETAKPTAPPEETFEPAPSPEAPPEQDAPPEETPPVETAPPEETPPAETAPPDPALMTPEELAEWIDEQGGDIGAILSGLQDMELDIGHAPGEYGATVDFLQHGFSDGA